MSMHNPIGDVISGTGDDDYWYQYRTRAKFRLVDSMKTLSSTVTKLHHLSGGSRRFSRLNDVELGEQGTEIRRVLPQRISLALHLSHIAQALVEAAGPNGAHFPG